MRACPATFTDVIFSNNVQLEGNKRGEEKHSPGPENTTFVTGSRLFAIKLNKIRLLNDFVLFCCIPRGKVSSPTYSPRREFVAAATFTQIRIYRVNIDDRSSDDRS